MHNKSKNRVSSSYLKLFTHFLPMSLKYQFYDSCTAGFSRAVPGGNWLVPSLSAEVSRTFTAK